MERNTQELRPSVRKMLLTPILTGMILLLALIGGGLYWQYITYYNRQIATNHAAVVRLYTHSIRNYQGTMRAVLKLISRDNRVPAYLLAHDGASLQAAYGQTFTELRRVAGLNYLLFVNANREVIARMHMPGEKGDIVQRPAFSEAEQKRGVVSGLDAGVNGLLTLRMVVPVFAKDQLAGFIEAAMDVDAIIAAAAEAQQLDLAFLLDKRHMTEERVRYGPVQSNAPAFWLDAGGDNLIYTSLNILDRAFATALLERHSRNTDEEPGERFNLFRNGSYFVVSTMPLTDSLGNALGEMLVIENATRLWNEYVLMALLAGGAGILVVVVSRRFIAAKLEATDNRILNMVMTIREGEKILENIFGMSGTGLVLLDKQSGMVRRANPAALRFFHAASIEEIAFTKLVPLSPDEEIQKDWQTPLLRLVSENGVAYYEVNSLDMDSEHNLRCLAISDVTEGVMLQIGDRRHIKFLQAVIDQLPNFVCIKDSEMRVVLYNNTFARIFGKGQSMTGAVRHTEEIGGAMDTLLAADQEALHGNAQVERELTMTFPDGREYTHIITKRKIVGTDGQAYLLTAGMDITERKRMTDQLILLREKAEEANQAKGQFLARMSHEIRTPMNVILGMSHLALSANPEEKQRGYLNKIRAAAGNLLGIINDILDFSKIESGAMTLQAIPFSLDALLEEMAEETRSLLVDSPLAFTLAAEAFPSRFLGDPLRLRQVLLNLINNAVKFTEHGRIRLCCEILEESDARCEVYFAVEDTGIGIPEDSRDRMFDSFQQVDGGTTRKYGGTGLGLAICKELVSLMGGVLRVESTLGEGSTFSFSLPLLKAGAADERQPQPASLELEAGDSDITIDRELDLIPGKVLIVEDNELNQEIITELLQNHKLTVQAANNGLEAVRLLKEGETFDLVFMDLQMPVMGGLEATQNIRNLADARSRSVPIIALTANAMQEDRERCREAGMNDFLSKPIDVADLQSTLERWLGPGETRVGA